MTRHTAVSNTLSPAHVRGTPHSTLEPAVCSLGQCAPPFSRASAVWATVICVVSPVTLCRVSDVLALVSSTVACTRKASCSRERVAHVPAAFDVLTPGRPIALLLAPLVVPPLVEPLTDMSAGAAPGQGFLG